MSKRFYFTKVGDKKGRKDTSALYTQNHIKNLTLAKRCRPRLIQLFCFSWYFSFLKKALILLDVI
jgi:hypothetical protein